MFAWVTLDRRDSDPVRFWTYVIEALRMISPTIGAGSLALLTAPGVDLAAEMLPVLMDELGDLPAPVVIALDDYHQIEGDAVHATVSALLDYLPPTVSVAIAIRSDPPLPIARLRAHGQLVDIDARALMFSLQEADAFLNGMLGLGLNEADLRRLYERTEWWPAGLYLAALSLRDRPDPGAFVASFTSDDRHIVDYLIEEVLVAQQPAVREFMVATSILERMNGAVSSAVLETTSAAATLDRLARSNLFMVELDDRRNWYRYHHLLHACLSAELAHQEPSLASVLHRRAAGWYLAEGHVSDAIHHTIEAGDHDEARELAAAAGDMVAAAERVLSSSRRARAAEEGLSERKLMVLRLLATNLTQREIGGQLYLSLNTVKSHTRSIFRKLGVSDREQAVARARELGLI
jgi:LuxR family maltose regulon positive regulatory protein